MVREHWGPALRCPSSEASPSRQVGPYTPGPFGWSSLETSFSESVQGRAKGPHRNWAPRIPIKSMRFLLTVRFHLNCATNYRFCWHSWQFSRATQFKTNVYLIRIWLFRLQSSWKWNRSCCSQFAKLLQSPWPSSYKRMDSSVRSKQCALIPQARLILQQYAMATWVDHFNLAL